MSAKLDNAFEFYVGMGVSRSYRAVAGRFGASLRSVTKCAARERWRERLREIERRAKVLSDERLVAIEVERRIEQYKKIVKAQNRALQALEEHPTSTVSEAIEVLEISMRFERDLLDRKHERTRILAETLARDAVTQNGSSS